MSYINKIIGTDFETRYPDDVKRIQEVSIKHGYFLTPLQAEAIWDAYSDDMAAGWMKLPEDDEELWDIISS